MKQLLLVSCLLFAANTFSQLPVQIHLKKNGRVKKKIEPGAIFTIKTTKGDVYQGALLQLKKDSLYFSYVTVSVNDITELKFSRKKERMKIDKTEFAYVTLGVGLTAAGLTLADWKELPAALGIAVVIGYSPYVLRLLKSVSFRKRSFKVGKQYTLSIWDIR